MYYAYLTINMTIQLDCNANAVSEAFRACCAPLTDANCLCVCVGVYSYLALCRIYLNASVSKIDLK